MRRPGIYLIRPLTLLDPSMVKIDGEYLLPKVLWELVRQEILTEVIVCIPENIPRYIKKLLDSWGLPLVITKAEFPTARLHEVIDRYNYDVVACFSAYNYLVPGAAIKTAFKIVTGGNVDAVYSAQVITAKKFTVMNRSAAKWLHEESHLPLPPNRFHQKLIENSGSLKISAIKDLESAGERFLWDLYYMGEREIIPERILRSHYLEKATEEWFEAEKFKTLLADDLHIEDWDWLDEYFADNDDVALRGTAFAAQISWYQRWQQ